MTLINTDWPSNLFVQPQMRSEGDAGRTLDLRPEQLVRALVVARDGQDALLEIRQNQFLARSERVLQVGQTLRLEVLQSEPRLEFRVLSDPLREHLQQRLPLLARPYEWSRLGDHLPRSGTVRQTELYRIFSNLFPERQLNEADIRQQLEALLPLLKQISGRSSLEISAVTSTLRPGTVAAGDNPLAPAMEALIRQLDSRLISRERGLESAFPADWKEQFEQLSATLTRQYELLPRIPATQQHALFRVYHRLLQAQLLSPAAAARGEQILSRLQPLLTAEAEDRSQLQLVQRLQTQLDQLNQFGGRPPDRGWIRQSESLFQLVRQQLGADSSQPGSQLRELFTLVRGLRQHAQFPSVLAARLEPLLVELERQLIPRTSAAQQSEDQSQLKLVQRLQTQLDQLGHFGGRGPDRGWIRQSESLFQLVRKQLGADSSQHGSQLRELFTLLRDIRQHRQFPPVLAARLEPLLVELEPQLNSRTAAVEQPAPGTGQPPLPVRVSLELERLVAQLQQATQQGRPLSPDLVGRLEGLLEKLHPLTVLRDQALPQSIPGLDIFISQLGQSTGPPAALPATGEQLGLLAQFFGLHLERELLQGRYRDALKTLKASLLKMRREDVREADEPLRRVELFQLCKARLAEEQVQFLPLPLPELEEGYLLAERQSSETDKTGEEMTKLSLSLRLSALGSLRVDMVFTGQGLQLQMVSENRQTMDYLRDCANELRQSVQSVNVHNLSFATGAGLPGKQLQERLLPDLTNLLDMRA